MAGQELRVRTKKSLVYEISVGAIPKPRSAAIGYVDDLILEQDTSLTPDSVKGVFLEGLPFVSSVVTTPWGPLATVILPRMQSEVFEDPDVLLRELSDALRLCSRLGVRCCSLTGLIPSATDTGRKVHELRQTLAGGGEEVPEVTTGHATTTACMALNIKRILKEAGRGDMREERLGFLGLGSVGMATLRLTLRVLPHAKELVLCDVYEKEGFLRELERECREEHGFKGVIRLAVSRGGAPEEVYGCSLIVAATNVGGILDVGKLGSGTCVVDDSAPHVFDTTKMWTRIKERCDVLATEGGPLRLEAPLTERFSLPTRWSLNDPDGFAAGTKKDHREVMGCTLSSLLTANEPSRLPPQVGTVEVDESERHFVKLTELGCIGCELNIDEVHVPEESIRRFKEQTVK
eukprot:Hpha_TRINITY_DN15476_c4_g1::TRINITY_DN15476_c4_g1_i1::g.175789::m.175789